ncbi:hypothetical protein GQR36_03385 [Enterococcus termitis]
MIALLKNNGFRLIQKHQRLLLMLGIMVISIIIAIYMSGRENAPLHIGVIGDEHHELVSNQRITVSHLTEDPSMLQLLKGEYDAVITKEKTSLR